LGKGGGGGEGKEGAGRTKTFERCPHALSAVREQDERRKEKKGRKGEDPRLEAGGLILLARNYFHFNSRSSRGREEKGRKGTPPERGIRQVLFVGLSREKREERKGKEAAMRISNNNTLYY